MVFRLEPKDLGTLKIAQLLSHRPTSNGRVCVCVCVCALEVGVFISLVTGTEPRDLPTLGKCSTVELHPNIALAILKLCRPGWPQIQRSACLCLCHHIGPIPPLAFYFEMGSN